MYLASACSRNSRWFQIVVADRGAGLVVRAHVGQFVIGAESLARGARADAAGDVQLLAGHVLPDLVERVDVRHVAGERGDVGHAGVHVHRAHRVAARHGLGLVHYLHLRLHVGIAGALLRALRSADVQHELGEVEIAHVAGDTIQLRQAHLNDLVAGPDFALAGAEGVVRAGWRCAVRYPAGCAYRWPGSAPRPLHRGGPDRTVRGC